MWDPPREKKDCVKQSKISFIIIDDENVELKDNSAQRQHNIIIQHIKP